MLTVLLLSISTLLIFSLDPIQLEFLTINLGIKRKKKSVFSGDVGKANEAFRAYKEHEGKVIELIVEYEKMKGSEDVKKVDPAVLRQEVEQVQTKAKQVRGTKEVAQA